MADNELDFEDKPFTWIDHLQFKLAQSGYDDGLPLPQWTPAAAADPVAEGFQAERINSLAPQQAPNQADGQSPQQMPDAPSVQPGPSAGNAPVPEHLKWVNDPKLLSNYLDKFNKQNPLYPGNAPKPVADVFGSMKGLKTTARPRARTTMRPSTGSITWATPTSMP